MTKEDIKEISRCDIEYRPIMFKELYTPIAEYKVYEPPPITVKERFFDAVKFIVIVVFWWCVMILISFMVYSSVYISQSPAESI